MKLTIELSEDTLKELRERYVCFSDTLEGRILKAVSEGIPVDTRNCSSCEHTDDECRDCYPELGYKNSRQKQDTEAITKFAGSSAFKKLMGEEAYHDIRRQM